MVKVVYANKYTGTTVHDIYLECKADEVKDYVSKLGTEGYDFPEKLTRCLSSKEIDYILVALSNKHTVSNIVNSFYVSCEQNIWEKVSRDDFINAIKEITMETKSLSVDKNHSVDVTNM